MVPPGKAIAFYPLFYGKEYLAWSIRSVQDAVDEIHVLYTDRPSYGHGRQEPGPESEEDLVREARRFAEKPIFWHRGRWAKEGDHRDAIYPIAKERGASQVLAVDADEVWAPGQAAAALAACAGRPEGIVRMRFCHFWRSFKWVCRDATAPQRVYNLRTEGGPSEGVWYLDPQAWPVFHFGYAISSALVRFKWTCHGHQSELRPGWLDEKFLRWSPGVGDVHPTNAGGFWTPEATDRATLRALESVLGDHPYWGMDVIP